MEKVQQNDIQRLWQFIRILVANNLEELQASNKTLELRAKTFICDRLSLLIASGYTQIVKPNDLSQNDSDEELIATSIWRLKIAEKTILKNHLNYFTENF